MISLNTNKTAVRHLWSLPLQRPGTKFMVLSSLFLAYPVLFWFLLDRLGSFAAVFFSVPVFFTGLYFGTSAGWIASVFGLLLNFLLLTRLENYTLLQFIQLWPGYLAIFVIGFFAGYIHDEAIAQKRIGDEIESRERFIALISIATKSIAGTSKPEEAYYRLLTHLTNLFTADYAYLIRWDNANSQASLVAATKEIEELSYPLALSSDETYSIEASLQSRRCALIEDVKKSNFPVNPAPFNRLSLPTKSALIIPFLVEGYFFGVAILAFDSTRQFTSQEIVYVELASSQITLALRTLQQQVEIEAQLREAKALANIERALSESERVGVDKVLQLIVDSAIELIPKTKKVILHLLDEKKQILVPRAVAGIKAKPRKQLNMRPGEGIAGQVMAMGNAITIKDVHTDTRVLNQTKPANFRSLVVVPIKRYDESIGTISIHSNVANAFTENEVTLLETLGTQVAIAIENANLVETLEQRVQQRTHDLVVLYNLITIISENWRLQDLLELSLVLTIETLRADRGIIYLVDGEEMMGLKPVIQRGFVDGFQVDNSELPGGELAQLVFKQFKPLVLEDLADYPGGVKLNSMNSYAGIPISVRGEVRGVFSLFAHERGLFGSDQMALLSSIADHLGIGIENSILWEKSRESAVLEERNRLARNLHDSVSQLLYSLTLMAGSTRKMIERGYEQERVKNSVFRLEETAHQALKEMRLLLYELRPAVLDSEGLASALRHRIETVEERLGVKVDLQADDLPKLPGHIEDALYHIALEALNNIVKHSESTSARIRFTIENGEVVMEIADHGKGFEVNRSYNGLGLRNMHERSQMIGCEVAIDSQPGRGTVILVKVKMQSASLTQSLEG